MGFIELETGKIDDTFFDVSLYLLGCGEFS